MDESVEVKQKRPQEYLSKEFMDELVCLMKKEGTVAAHGRGKVVGFETKKVRYHALVQGFKELKALGFKLQSPKGLQERHVKALAQSWEADGLSSSTICKRRSGAVLNQILRSCRARLIATTSTNEGSKESPCHSHIDWCSGCLGSAMMATKSS